MIDGKTILITGITGSFGSAFVRKILKDYRPKKIIGVSRDEMKQWEFKNELRVEQVTLSIGDVRDAERIEELTRGVDILIHAAATKIVPTAESNPSECIKTNILGAFNVIASAKKNGIKKVVALSTDKACNPVNLYGASKLASDKLFIAANDNCDTQYSVVRYGNVINSRGSVIPFFKQCRDSGVIPVTDKRMTRFMISMDQAIDLVIHAITHSRGGEIFVRKIPSIGILDIAATVAPQAKLEIVGIRPGEKLHEQMISEIDALTCYEFQNHYTILPTNGAGERYSEGGVEGHLVRPGFEYRSDTNSDWMTPSELKAFI